MKILVLTGYDDQGASLGDACIGSQRAYSLRRGYDFEVVREYHPGSHPSWQKIRLLKERVHKYDTILWLDCDTVVTNPSIRIEDLVPPTLFGASCDWCAPPGDDTKTAYISCGNFILRNTSDTNRWLDAVLSQERRFSNRPCWEQDAVLDRMRNCTWFDAQVTRFQRRNLNPVSADVTGALDPWRPGDFICHLTGLGDHGHRLLHVPLYDRAHILSITNFIPEHWESGSCADRRHILWLRDILASVKPARTLEVGVHSGCTASAFIDANVPDAVFCDISVRSDARAIVGERLIQSKGSDTILSSERFDFVFLDGAHDLESVKEEWSALQYKMPNIIAAHDVNSNVAGFPYCEGPAWLRDHLVSEGWLVSSDDLDRPEEVTKRGIMFATRDPALHHLIEKARLMSCW